MITRGSTVPLVPVMMMMMMTMTMTMMMSSSQNISQRPGSRHLTIFGGRKKFWTRCPIILVTRLKQPSRGDNLAGRDAFDQHDLSLAMMLL